ncbi:MAG: helix-turn-helix transcriptional regulator, partial [Thermomicrobiales bacterium]
MTDDERTYPYDNPFARRIREAREATGWTQQEAARHVALSRTHLAALESGRQTTHNPLTLNRIADAYGIARNELAALVPLTSGYITRKTRRQIEGHRDARYRETYPDDPFAARLRDLRAASGWTRKEAAARIGISVGYLAGLENGTQSTRKPHTIAQIAYAYGIERADLAALAPETNIEYERRKNEPEAPPPRSTDDWYAE